MIAPSLKQSAALFLTLAALAIATPALRAQETLLSNLPSNDGGFGYVNSSTFRAVSFTTSGTTFNITSATMRLVDYVSSSDTAQLTIRINEGDAPSSSVYGSFTSPSSGSDSPGNFVFTPTSAITLEANTTYWMVITSPNSGDAFAWERSNPVVTPTGPFVFGIQAISYNSGTNWQEGSNGPHSFAIVGEAVPEPAAIALLGLGLAVFLFARRRPSTAH